LPAESLTWSLDNVTFNDGGIATGSFTIDASLNSVLNWNISVSGGDQVVFPTFNYTPATAPSPGIFIVDGGGVILEFGIDINAPVGTPESRRLILTTDGPLTDAGGTVQLITDPLGESRECYNCSPQRSVVTGSVTAVIP